VFYGCKRCAFRAVIPIAIAAFPGLCDKPSNLGTLAVDHCKKMAVVHQVRNCTSEPATIVPLINRDPGNSNNKPHFAPYAKK
jgi:hypothetical protein